MCVNGPIEDTSANLIIAQLLYLESEHPEKPVGAGRGGQEFRLWTDPLACTCWSGSRTSLPLQCNWPAPHHTPARILISLYRSACTSTPLGVWLPQGWPSTTPCSTFAAPSPRWRWARRPPWRPSSWPLGSRGTDGASHTAGSCCTSPAAARRCGLVKLHEPTLSHPGSSQRHRDPGQGDPEDAVPAQRPVRPAHGPDPAPHW